MCDSGIDKRREMCYNIGVKEIQMETYEYIDEKGNLTKIIARDGGLFNEDGSPAELPKLDYKIKDREERIKRVELITSIAPKEKLTKTYLERMGDYIISAMSKEEKKAKRLLPTTGNSQLTKENLHSTKWLRDLRMGKTGFTV